MHYRDLATQHILDLEEHNKELRLRARIVKEETEIEHLYQLQVRRKDSFPLVRRARFLAFVTSFPVTVCQWRIKIVSNPMEMSLPYI